MKQRDIDNWVSRQNRINRQAYIPTINWVAIAVVITVAVAVLFILLGAANLL